MCEIFHDFGYILFSKTKLKILTSDSAMISTLLFNISFVIVVLADLFDFKDLIWAIISSLEKLKSRGPLPWLSVSSVLCVVFLMFSSFLKYVNQPLGEMWLPFRFLVSFK